MAAPCKTVKPRSVICALEAYFFCSSFLGGGFGGVRKTWLQIELTMSSGIFARPSKDILADCLVKPECCDE